MAMREKKFAHAYKHTSTKWRKAQNKQDTGNKTVGVVD